MTSNDLLQLGWQPFFQQQLSLEEWEGYRAFRIFEQHRSNFNLVGETGNFPLTLSPNLPAMTVGDWCLLDQSMNFYRLLDRKSLFSRKAAGSKVDTQLIAANIDTVFIVTSANQDFNLNRLERFLAMVSKLETEVVIVISKADLCESTDDFVSAAQSLNRLIEVVTVNGLSEQAVTTLSPWCRPGKTIALLGSSGVGKSTLVNTLLGETNQTTGGTRENDDKGRHTTTGRSLHVLPKGGLLLDTPGLRQIQLSDCDEGLDNVFNDIIELANQCKFSNCQHQSEPGCAVIAALEKDLLDVRHLNNYRKLQKEQAFNDASLAEKRERDRKLGKMYRKSQAIHNLKRNN